MCGRFAFYSPSEATAALFGVENAPPVEPRYNIAPTQYIAAIRDADSGSRELKMLRWGLVPFWAKDPSIGNRMINARAETVAEKPSFRSAFKKRRCLILADGFYEWHTEAGVKTPYFISAADSEPFAFAGLWEDWKDKQTGESLQTATIITTPANSFMESLHHRMPVILQRDTAAVWLDGKQDLLQDVPAITPKLRAWPVARTVNNARNEGEDLLAPAGDTRVEG
ncbi:MAG: SOS response-associated peptidase [Woeseia sp.]